MKIKIKDFKRKCKIKKINALVSRFSKNDYVEIGDTSNTLKHPKLDMTPLIMWSDAWLDWCYFCDKLRKEEDEYLGWT